MDILKLVLVYRLWLLEAKLSLYHPMESNDEMQNAIVNVPVCFRFSLSSPF